MRIKKGLRKIVYYILYFLWLIWLSIVDIQRKNISQSFMHRIGYNRKIFIMALVTHIYVWKNRIIFWSFAVSYYTWKRIEGVSCGERNLTYKRILSFRVFELTWLKKINKNLPATPDLLSIDMDYHLVSPAVDSFECRRKVMIRNPYQQLLCNRWN